MAEGYSDLDEYHSHADSNDAQLLGPRPSKSLMTRLGMHFSSVQNCSPIEEMNNGLRAERSFMLTVIVFAVLQEIGPPLVEGSAEDLTVLILMYTDFACWGNLNCDLTFTGLVKHMDTILRHNRQGVVNKVQAIEKRWLVTTDLLREVAESSSLETYLSGQREALRASIYAMERCIFYNVGEGLLLDQDGEHMGVVGDGVAVSWMPFKPHPALIKRYVPIIHNGEGIQNTLYGSASCPLLRRPIVKLNPLFTRRQGKDGVGAKDDKIESSDRFVFSRDGAGRDSAPGWTAHGKIDYTRCLISTDGTLRTGDVRTLYQTPKVGDNPALAALPRITVENNSAAPAIYLNFDEEQGARQSPKLCLDVSACDHFGIRVVPAPDNSCPSDEANHMEVQHQWPGVAFESKSKDPPFAIEIFATATSGTAIHLAKDSLSMSGILQTPHASLVRYLFDATHIHLVTCTSATNTRTKWELLRTMLNAGRAGLPGSNTDYFQHLHHYQKALQVLPGESIIRNLISDPGYPPVQIHLADPDLQSSKIGLLNYPIEHRSIDKTADVLALAMKRAEQDLEGRRVGFMSKNHMAKLAIQPTSGALSSIDIGVQLRDGEEDAKLIPPNPQSLSVRLYDSRNRPICSSDRVEVISINDTLNSTDTDVILRVTSRNTGELENVMREMGPGNRIPIKITKVPQVQSKFQDAMDLVAALNTYKPRPKHFNLVAFLQGAPQDDFTLAPDLEAPSTPATILTREENSRSLTPPELGRLLENAKGILRGKLDEPQQTHFDKVMKNVVKGYLELLGPFGSGKSSCNAAYIAALAMHKKVLVTATTNSAVKSLMAKTLEVLQGMVTVLPRVADRFRVSRYAAHHDERPRVLQSEGSRQFRNKAHLHDELYGGFNLGVDAYDCGIIAQKVAEHYQSAADAPEDAKDLARQYFKALQSMQFFSSEARTAFDKAESNILKHIVHDMNIVFATLEQAQDLVKMGWPQYVILDEHSVVNLPDILWVLLTPEGASTVEALLLSGNPVQNKPVVPSLFSQRNEFASVLAAPFVDWMGATHPAHQTALTGNHRSPAQMITFLIEHYKDCSGIEIKPHVDVTKQPYFHEIQEALRTAGFANGQFREIDLRLKSQLWINVNSHASAVDRAAIRGNDWKDVLEASENSYAIRTTDGHEVSSRLDPQTVYINTGTHAAIAELLYDAVIFGIPYSAILIQAASVSDCAILSKTMQQEFGHQQGFADLAIMSNLNSQGMGRPLVLTSITTCGCDWGTSRLPSDKNTSVLLSRAMVCHMVVGNHNCLSFNSKKKTGAPVGGAKQKKNTGAGEGRTWFKDFIAHVKTADEIVPFIGHEVRKARYDETYPSALPSRNPRPPNTAPSGFRGNQQTGYSATRDPALRPSRSPSRDYRARSPLGREGRPGDFGSLRDRYRSPPRRGGYGSPPRRDGYGSPPRRDGYVSPPRRDRSRSPYRAPGRSSYRSSYSDTSSNPFHDDRRSGTVRRYRRRGD